MDDRVEKMLREQSVRELSVSNAYLAAASEMSELGMENTVQYLLAQAKEERGHADLFFEYMMKVALPIYLFEVPAIENKETGSTLLKWLCFAFALESDNLQKMKDLCEAALASKDYETFSFVQSMIAEQVSEVDQAETVLSMARSVGSNHASFDLWIRDTYLNA